MNRAHLFSSAPAPAHPDTPPRPSPRHHGSRKSHNTSVLTPSVALPNPSLRWPSSGAPPATTPSAPPAGPPSTLAESGACTATAPSPPEAASQPKRSPRTGPTPVPLRRERALSQRPRAPLGTAVVVVVQGRRRRRRRRGTNTARLPGWARRSSRWTRQRRWVAFIHGRAGWNNRITCFGEVARNEACAKFIAHVSELKPIGCLQEER